MSIAIVTGSSGLIGSETAKFLHEQGLEIHGIDNNLREYFFGPDGSVEWKTRELRKSLPRFHHRPIDIRDTAEIPRLFESLGRNVSLVVHTAAQPSHDWASREPLTDFTVNALGTANLLEATRLHCPDATFILTSTNKVYGDRPNRFPLVEEATRWELDPSHPYHRHGIDESLSIDESTHSLMGASKLSADVLAQEYGRYFGLRTGIFRGGCLTGPSPFRRAELHGFLSLPGQVRTFGSDFSTRMFGYKGKQVRDNIHSREDRREASSSQFVDRNPRCGRGLQPRRLAPQQLLGARGHRAGPGSHRARARVRAPRRAAPRRPHLVDQRRAEVPEPPPGLALPLRPEKRWWRRS